MRVLVPVVKVNGKLFLSPHFGRAPGFAVYEVQGSEIANVQYVDNPYRNPEEHSGHGRMILNLVSSFKPEAVIVRSIGEGAFYRLKSLGARIYRSTDRLADEAVLKLVRNELEELQAPVEEHEH
ncbi:NifB/NifX family molybdenum-iron cluster-binding protein [Infirmifilum sp. SLHALR2]